jgi:DNA polymerase epsilon subunit 2
LPTALVLADAEVEPFLITYEGCHVMNPGRLVPEGDKSLARWIEYDLLKRKGNVREQQF